MRKTTVALLVSLFLFAPALAQARGKEAERNYSVPRTAATIQVNGIEIHYERCGSGSRSLILLHGNGGSLATFDALGDRLAADFTVYALDSRGHGGSSRVPRLHYDDMAEDVAAFIAALGLEKPLVYGFSDGGIVGLILAMKHPGLLGKLATSGANLYPEGLRGGELFLMKLAYFFGRQDRVRMMIQEPRIDPAALGAIDVPILVLAGEKDAIREAHTRLIAASIPGSSLRILPGETHSSYVHAGDKLSAILEEFFR